jgi:hypothetical protein
MPYGDEDGSGRTYKNIVPAPPKALEAKIVPGATVPIASTLASGTVSAAVVSSVQPTARSPKRKREDEFDGYDQTQPLNFDQTYSDHSCNSRKMHCD